MVSIEPFCYDRCVSFKHVDEYANRGLNVGELDDSKKHNEMKKPIESVPMGESPMVQLYINMKDSSSSLTNVDHKIFFFKFIDMLSLVYFGV